MWRHRNVRSLQCRSLELLQRANSNGQKWHVLITLKIQNQNFFQPAFHYKYYIPKTIPLFLSCFCKEKYFPTEVRVPNLGTKSQEAWRNRLQCTSSWATVPPASPGIPFFFGVFGPGSSGPNTHIMERKLCSFQLHGTKGLPCFNQGGGKKQLMRLEYFLEATYFELPSIVVIPRPVSIQHRLLPSWYHRWWTWRASSCYPIAGHDSDTKRQRKHEQPHVLEVNVWMYKLNTL